MALALNNRQRVDMPLSKETKPNQTKPSDQKQIVSSYTYEQYWILDEIYELFGETLFLLQTSDITILEIKLFHKFIQTICFIFVDFITTFFNHFI